MATPSPARLDREMIVDAAVQLLRDGDAAAVTLRRVAENVGTTAMALYHHVGNKEELMTEVLERYLRDEPFEFGHEWREWIENECAWLRGFLVHHPWAADLFLSRPIITPSQLRRMDDALAIVVKAGFSLARAAEIYALATAFTIGFAALELGRSDHQGGSEYWGAFWRTLDPDEYPLLHQLAPEGENYIADRGFSVGLDAIVTGIATADHDHGKPNGRNGGRPDNGR